MDLTRRSWFVRVIRMFWPNFEKVLVEEESCEITILLMDPSRSSLDTYVRMHARTDVPTYCIALTHTHMHAGTHEYNWIRKPIVTKNSQTHKGLKIQNLKTIIETRKTRIFTKPEFSQNPPAKPTTNYQKTWLMAWTDTSCTGWRRPRWLQP